LPEARTVGADRAGILDEADEALTKAGQFIRANVDSGQN
jgi:hypothetical protein